MVAPIQASCVLPCDGECHPGPGARSRPRLVSSQQTYIPWELTMARKARKKSAAKTKKKRKVPAKRKTKVTARKNPARKSKPKAKSKTKSKAKPKGIVATIVADVKAFVDTL